MNNPVYFVDPDGMLSQSFIDKLMNTTSGTTWTNNNDGTFSSNTGGKFNIEDSSNGDNGNQPKPVSITKSGQKVLEAKTSVLGKLWATLEPREWVDQTTGLVYNVDASGKITRLRPLGGLGPLGYINGPSGVKLLVQFGKTENQVYHTFRHIEKMGLNKTVVQNAIMKHFQTVYKEIKEGQSLNKVITVQGQQIQYSAYKLSDGTINIGRIHGVK